MSHNRPDIVVIDKNTHGCHIVDVACPVDSRICLKEHEKEEKYFDLAFEVKRLWQLQKVRITPIIIGTLVTYFLLQPTEEFRRPAHWTKHPIITAISTVGIRGNSPENPGTLRWCVTTC